MGLMIDVALLMISGFPGAGENSKCSINAMSIACISSNLARLSARDKMLGMGKEMYAKRHLDSQLALLPLGIRNIKLGTHPMQLRTPPLNDALQ